ncbi:MAG: hypothetical protein Q7O12_01995 [Deltaproteobacteria bacterium]|nr:hypothetical protein [Deltaproteobacteria bacterium]
MERQKRAKARGAAEPTPLSPEARANLESQVARVAGFLSAEVDPAALQAQVSPDPQDPDWDAHLIAALGALSHPAIPPLLAALFGAARDKLRRKALKKTLHRLKTRGVAMAPDLLPKEEVSFGAPRPGAAKVFVSPIFGIGESYVILEAPPEILGGNFLVSRVSDQEGFKECVLLSLKRQQQAEVWGRFREQGLDQWFSPPPAYAVRLLEEAYAHKDGAGSGGAQYGVLREKIFRHWGRPESAPDLDQELPPPSPGELPRLLEHCRELALDPLFLSFLPGPEEIAPWLIKLKEVEDSPLVLSDQQKQVRTDGVLDEATRALYPLETRADCGRRLLTTAYYLHLTGREEDSRVARAAVADLVAPELSALAGENAFLKSLVQYAVRLAYEMQQPREPATSSGLIATPGEAGLIRR